MTEPNPVNRHPRPADAQAEVFDHVRQAHSMESTEDYVELIDDLIQTQGEARLVDLAERLGISQPTAGKTVARLQRDGFVTSEPRARFRRRRTSCLRRNADSVQADHQPTRKKMTDAATATSGTLTIARPDDWHLHLRDGETLQAVIGASARDFQRALIMPNLVPPVTPLR